KTRLVVPHIGGSKNNQTRRRNGSRYSEVNGQREGASLNLWMRRKRRAARGHSKSFPMCE
ncbi:hypothetical protein V1478_016542, partial [Vespula squamosa]